MNDIVRRNDPFDIFSRFGDFFDRDPFLAPASRTEWLPPVDIKETADGYRFHMDVPGLKPEDLEVELHEGVLSIRGSRNEEKREEDKGYVRTERRYGSFSRQFRVPTTVQADSLKAEVKDGVLTIEVPKGAEQGARKVPVS
ncbi:MAG: Hsp20/alpha crystallin family protein [Gammaproteobacteria bacterium]|jgi:HSP20 family protein